MAEAAQTLVAHHACLVLGSEAHGPTADTLAAVGLGGPHARVPVAPSASRGESTKPGPASVPQPQGKRGAALADAGQRPYSVRVTIPMTAAACPGVDGGTTVRPTVESLNVAAAGAILLHALR